MAEQHHLVSRGYQNNFAVRPRKVLTIFDAKTGDVVDQERPTLSNWRLPDFNSFIADDGQVIAQLEREWARIEAKVLDQIRRVRVGNFDTVLEAAVMNFMAIHLVRSEPYLEAHRRVMAQVMDEVPAALDGDPRALTAFEQSLGRKAEPGEIENLARRLAADREESNYTFVESMARVHERLGEIMAGWRVQVVESSPDLPGFVLPDVPVVHYSRSREAFGFRDHLALGDGDVIGAPLTPHTAVFLTADRPRHARVTTKKRVRLINAFFWRSALREVACHPDDAREAQRVHDHLYELPPHELREWSAHSNGRPNRSIS